HVPADRVLTRRSITESAARKGTFHRPYPAPDRDPRRRRSRRGGAAHGVSFTRRPWTGRPAAPTNRAQPSHCPVSFTTLHKRTMTPCFRPTGPTMFSPETSRV